MIEENISQEFRLKEIGEIKQNEVISTKHKKVCKTLNYIEHLLIFASTVTGCISISAFVSLICIRVGI